MIDKIYIKIYFLFCFLFLFIVSMWKFIHIDYLYVIICIYWVVILPLKYFFSNFFDKKDLRKKTIIFVIFTIISYFISVDLNVFIILLFFNFFVFFKLNLNNLFLFWIILFSLFIFTYVFGFDIKTYSSFLAFSFYSFLFGIIYFLFNLLFNIIKSFIKLDLLLISKIVFLLFFIVFLFSFYFTNLIYLSTILFFIFFITSSFLEKNKLYLSFWKDYLSDLIILSLFFIIFLPFINDFLVLENKNTILFTTFLSFIISYIWFNLMFKRVNKN